MTRALVHGLAIAGAATARALLRRGVDVVVADDDVTAERRRIAEQLDVELLEAPDTSALERTLRTCDLLCPAPGVPERHPVIATATNLGVPVRSEIELAYEWEQARPGGPRPMLAITGTDGKTTTTLLTVAMLRAAGLRTLDAGNTEVPLVDAIDLDLDVLVAECTSFRLAWTSTFRADGASWLNLAPDHLNWHASMATYEAAKYRIWEHQRPTDVAIGNAEDDAVAARLRQAPARHVSFGLAAGDYHLDGEHLRGPHGVITSRSEMWRALPHDVANALAAAALVLETGLVGIEQVATALAGFVGPVHRLQHVGTWDDVAWFDDSKATTPHAAAAAIRSFERVVLVAGGYDKGVDLSPMAVDRDRVVTVIGVGATGPAVASLFEGVPHVEVVPGLPEAVALADRLARRGDTVLLSPGCASFDQYGGFEERGRHFASLVRQLHGEEASSTSSGGRR